MSQSFQIVSEDDKIFVQKEFSKQKTMIYLDEMSLQYYIIDEDNRQECEDLNLKLNYNVKYVQIKEDKVFFCGGINQQEKQFNNECFILDLKQKKTYKKKSMKESKIGHSIVYYEKQNCVFVIGGTNEKREKLKTVEQYNIQNDNWVQFQSLKAGRTGAQSVIIENKIYLIGGLDQNQNPEIQIGVLDIQKNQWEFINIKNSINYLAAVDSAVIQINSDQIIILGGLQSENDNINLLNHVYLYDIKNNLISNLSPLFNLPLSFVADSNQYIINSVNHSQIHLIIKIRQLSQFYGPFYIMHLVINLSDFTWRLNQIQLLQLQPQLNTYYHNKKKQII